MSDKQPHIYIDLLHRCIVEVILCSFVTAQDNFAGIKIRVESGIYMLVYDWYYECTLFFALNILSWTFEKYDMKICTARNNIL